MIMDPASSLFFSGTWVLVCKDYGSRSRLGSYMCGYKCFQIEIRRGYDYVAFHDDLKKLYEMAGVQNLNTVFLFTDTQV